MKSSLILYASVFATLVHAAEPNSYFRSGSGVPLDDRVALPDDIESDSALLWRTPLASGHSSPPTGLRVKEIPCYFRDS